MWWPECQIVHLFLITSHQIPWYILGQVKESVRAGQGFWLVTCSQTFDFMVYRCKSWPVHFWLEAFSNIPLLEINAVEAESDLSLEHQAGQCSCHTQIYRPCLQVNKTGKT